MTVILGTLAHATAITILAPSLAIPPASYSLPTMKPRADTAGGLTLERSCSSSLAGGSGWRPGQLWKRCQLSPLTCYVLQKNKWNVSLAAQFDKMRTLQKKIRKGLRINSQRMFEAFLKVLKDGWSTVLVRAAQLLSPLCSDDSTPVSADIYRQRLPSAHLAFKMKEPRGLQPRVKQWWRGTEPPAARQLISIFFMRLNCSGVCSISVPPTIYFPSIEPEKKKKTKDLFQLSLR